MRSIAVVLVATLVAALSGAAREAAGSGASPGYHPTTVLVGFEAGATVRERAAAHDARGGRLLNRLDWLNLDVVRVPEGSKPPDVAAEYERNAAAVAYAQPNWVVTLAGAPNDALFPEQWGLHNTGQTGGTPDADIDAPRGWEIAFGPDTFPNQGGVRVGVIDTGVELTHPDLLGKTKACAQALSGTGTVEVGKCADDHGHGTFVSAVIAANTHNGAGIAGVAPNVELAEFKAIHAEGFGYVADVVAGIHWLHTTGGARIISMSIAGEPDVEWAEAELTEAYAAGTLLVAAAGNNGCDGCFVYPAGHPDVVSTGGTDHSDLHPSFSNCNDDVEVSAPAVEVWSATVGGSYMSGTGTSAAAPHAAGVAALVMWLRGTNHAQTRGLLTSSADDLGPPGRDDCHGFGRINLAAALSDPDTGEIAGEVRKRNGNPLPGATVDCPGAGSDETAADGSYAIAGVDPGTYSCTAGKAGWRPKTKPVTVHAGETARLSFKLRRS
jgi:thermitase